MHRKAVELKSGALLLTSAYWPELEVDSEIPMEFFRGEIQGMILWGRKEFEGKTMEVLMPDGMLVFCQQVGRNSTHHFFVGQSQGGRVFKVSGGEESVHFHELRQWDSCIYRGESEFLVWRDHISEIALSAAGASYWGHV